MDVAHKARHILGLHQTVFQQFRAAQNGLQGRFQFMGHVGGELPAVLLGVFCFRDVHRQNYQTDDFFAGGDAAEQKLINSALSVCLQFV